MFRTSLRILAWASIVALFVVTDTTMAMRPHTIISPNVDRLMALFCVGAVFSLAYPKRLGLVLVVLFGTIVSFELLQRLLVGRHGFVNDIIVKSIGCSAGALFAVTVQGLFRWRQT